MSEGRDIERGTQRKCPKRQRGGRREEARWEEKEAAWKKDERKESVVGETSGRGKIGGRYGGESFG